MPQTTILSGALTTPVNAAFSTATTGGTLAAGTYFYRVSATDASGETLASSEASQVTTGATSTVTVNWAAVSGAAGYRVYGRTTGTELLIATVGQVTTYTDTGSVTPAGSLPTSNTTGSGEGTSSTVTVASGGSAKVGIFASAGSMPASAAADVYATTPGANSFVTQLTTARPFAKLDAPGSYLVTRRANSMPFGIYSDT